MMRILVIAGVLIAAVSLDTRPSSAQEGPWCAIISLGPGSVYEDCQYYWRAIAVFVTRTRGG